MSFDLLLSIFILILPIFGKSFNYWESVILYGGTIILTLLSASFKPHHHLTKKFILLEFILITLSLLSTIFSANIGFSYYGFFNFIFSLLLLNLCLKYLEPKKLFPYLLIFSLVYSAIFLLNKFSLLALRPDSLYDNFILQVWGHSYLAEFLVFSIPYLLYQLFYSNSLSFSQKKFLYFSLFIISLTIILTNSRTAIISLAIGCIFLLFSKIPKHFRLTFIFLSLSLAFIFNYQLFFQHQNTKSLDGNRLEYWREAITAFTHRPLLGHGPANFFYLNKIYQNTVFTNTNFTHNSFLEYLCLNGLLFTLIFFTTIIVSLFYLSHQRQILIFTVALISFLNSLLDPSWNTIGIFCLSLFFIYHQNPLIVKKYSPAKNNHLFLIPLFIFFISHTLSYYLYSRQNFVSSLYVNPFNLNTRLALLPRYRQSTLFLYSHDFRLYQYLANTIPLPQSENYYYQLFSLAPKENIREYWQLANYYQSTKDYQKLSQLLNLAHQNLNVVNFIGSQTRPLAKIAYNLALINWQNEQFSQAINHFQIASYFGQGWSHFLIELANAYWHTEKKDLALKQLEVECQKFPASVKHCQQYLDQYSSETFLLPGTLDFQQAINSLP